MPAKRAKVPRSFYAVPSGELKFFDTAVGDQSVSGTTGVVLSSSLNLIEQGNTGSDRIGRKVTLRSVHLKFKVRQAAASGSTTTDNLFRIMVYHDKQCNGGAATAALLLASDDILGYRNLDNSSRFKILYDTTRAVYTTLSGNGTTSVSGEKQVYINVNKKCNIPLEFDASTGAITDLTSSNVGVIVWIQDSAPAVVFQMNARVRYSDR